VDSAQHVQRRRLLGGQPHSADRSGRGKDHQLPDISEELTSPGIFLVLRRMRIPLIVLIVIFAVSVLGLTLIPGQDEQGRPDRLGVFEAFYFMSYTATTIGFGEIPYSFTPAQRMWVIASIFLSVVGWAYAIGSLLALVQDRAFRQALARRHFARKVAGLAEPFLLLVGYGNAGQRLARSLDDMGRRFVVMDNDEQRVVSVELDSYRADTPALLADARDTGRLALAGLGYCNCQGVIALTRDDTTNLDVTMTAALLRPGLPVIARTSSREVGERMGAFGALEVVNPLDRFGDHLRILLRSPASYQLTRWLTSAPGSPLPARSDPLPRGRWVVYGYGRFGQELTADLRAEGLEVTVVEDGRLIDPTGGPSRTDPIVVADVEHAAAVVAATENDTVNLWFLQAASRANPDAILVAMQNRPGNSPLFREVGVDFGMVPAEVVAYEVLARLANPMLIWFLPQVPHQGEEWAARLVERLVDRCGTRTPNLWPIALTEQEAPALTKWLAAGEVRLGDLIRDPKGRESQLDVVPLALLHDGEQVLAPDDDHLLHRGDDLLVAGRSRALQALDATLVDGPTAAYVVGGTLVPSGWLWRRITRKSASPPQARG
jgi:Trk K+ transport system NAD-binding subunit